VSTFGRVEHLRADVRKGAETLVPRRFNVAEVPRIGLRTLNDTTTIAERGPSGSALRRGRNGHIGEGPSEFGQLTNIPASIYAHWSHANRASSKKFEKFQSLKVPGELGLQCRLLQLLVGAEPGVDRVAKRFSRQTYHLLNSIVGFGNFGQHLCGETVSLGTAVGVILLALEVAAQLATEAADTPGVKSGTKEAVVKCVS